MIATKLSLRSFTWDPTKRILVAEASDLELHNPGSCIQISSHHTGRLLQFDLVKVDRSPCGEDIAGWRYRNHENDINVLIIND